jgi:hypothetical protein
MLRISETTSNRDPAVATFAIYVCVLTRIHGKMGPKLWIMADKVSLALQPGSSTWVGATAVPASLWCLFHGR